jgi:hypothetical protein
MSLRPFRVELSAANAFVDQHHRHHEPVINHRFSLGVGDKVLCGVAICGRPLAKAIDQEFVLEVNRLATDGTRNACSWLYAAAARMAQWLGYRAVVTYTLRDGESGASLRAVGWWPEVLDERDSNWNSAGRGGQLTLDVLPLKRGQDLGAKVRWLWLTGCDS